MAFFLMMIAINLKLTQIYSKLVNIVYSPYDVSFTKFESLRQPLINLGRINLPDYLQYELQPSFGGTASNKHEKLFWFNSPRGLGHIIHGILLWQMAWVTWMLVDGYSMLGNWENAAATILSAGFTFANLLMVLPWNLKRYCLVTNVIMNLHQTNLIKREFPDPNAEREADH